MNFKIALHIKIHKMSIVYKSRSELIDTGFRIVIKNNKTFIEKDNEFCQIEFTGEGWDYDTYRILNRNSAFPTFIGYGGSEGNWWLNPEE